MPPTFINIRAVGARPHVCCHHRLAAAGCGSNSRAVADQYCRRRVGVTDAQRNNSSEGSGLAGEKKTGGAGDAASGSAQCAAHAA
jgi:hypothetical protein